MKKTATVPMPYEKAGMVIYGALSEGPQKGKRALIAPYTEGRFGDHDKYYVTPKGAIDRGEDMLIAAMREACEETGVDPAKLLGEEAIAALKRGETVGPFDSPGYPGVRVLKADPAFVDHQYTGRAGNEFRSAMFGVEVEHIEKLGPHLKNQENRNRAMHVSPTHVPMDMRMQKNDYPRFDDMLEWLRTMKMPARAWNASLEVRPSLVAFEASDAGEPTWFEVLEKNWARQHNRGKLLDPTKREDWQRFCATISRQDYKVLRGYFDEIKHEVKKLGILDDSDHALVKLDTKDCPLHFYQEGADIITGEELIASCFDRMTANADYARAFAGNTDTLRHKPLGQRIMASQLAAIAPFVQAEDITQGAERFTREINRPRVMDFATGKYSRQPYRDDAHTAPYLAWGAPPPRRAAAYSYTEPMQEMRAKLGGEGRVAWSQRIERESGLNPQLG